MDELLAFLRATWDARCAQLDEDERVARAADSGRWLPEDKGITFEWRADDFHGGEAQARLVADTRANQWHIANWDPARVLAEVALERADVEAKRRILVECESVKAEVREPTSAEHRANARARQFVLERVVGLLAQPYAGRDGWREEWRT